MHWEVRSLAKQHIAHVQESQYLKSSQSDFRVHTLNHEAI